MGLGILALSAESEDQLAPLPSRKRRKLRMAQAQARKPLQAHREEELRQMKLNFADPAHHLARREFVYKVPPAATPRTIALHRVPPVGLPKVPI